MITYQPTLDELGKPLSEVTFVVVDLETTGGRAGADGITEIGAVKVRGGEVIGEFQTLVNPGVAIPAQITVLTGITNAMVFPAPRIDEVLPTFLEFIHGAVLVAHNAPFDIGFLKAAARATGHPWPGNQVVDTVRLARAAVTRDEVPNYKLGTLAALFRAEVTPDHRALSDARATVDVLHALLGRLAGAGVTHLEDLASAADNVPMDVRRKRHLADALPELPGVYMFLGPGEEVLYVGTSKSLRSRVRTYFTAAETRKAVKEMVRIAHDVRPVVCATELEAQVRELRLIAEHRPRYNRRSKFPQRTSWVRLVEQGVARLSVVREVVPEAAHLGPFASRNQAQAAALGLLAAFRPPVPGTRAPMHLDPADLEAVRRAMLEDPSPVVDAHVHAIASMTQAQNFEAAAALRDRLAVFLRGASRAQRLAPLSASPELVAARPVPQGGWELVVVRHARLAATGIAPRGTDPMALVDSLRAAAEHVPAPVPPAPASLAEEADLVLAWLESPGVRLVELDSSSPWAWPVAGAPAHSDLSRTAEAVRRTVQAGHPGYRAPTGDPGDPDAA